MISMHRSISSDTFDFLQITERNSSETVAGIWYNAAKLVVAGGMLMPDQDHRWIISYWLNGRVDIHPLNHPHSILRGQV